MKTPKEVLDFCNEFIFYNHYIFNRVMDLTYVRDYLNIVLTESDFEHEDSIRFFIKKPMQIKRVLKTRMEKTFSIMMMLNLFKIKNCFY